MPHIAGRIVRMHTCLRRAIRFGLLLVAFGGPGLAARAADVPFAVGGVYGYGDGTDIYGVQAVWSPPGDNEFLDRHDLALRLTAQVSRWVARESQAQYHSLTDGNVMAELRYWLHARWHRCGRSSRPDSASTCCRTSASPIRT